MSDDLYFQADLGGEDEEGYLQAESQNGNPYYAEADLEASGLRGALRKGKWTNEEEAYANRIIHYFNHGALAINARTTLRSYLSEKLNCDPMRITKKFSGASCIGKQVYQPCEELIADKDNLRRIEEELRELEKVFLKRLFRKCGVSSSESLIDEFESSKMSHAMNFKAKLRSELYEKSIKPKRTASAPDLPSMNHRKKMPYSPLTKRHLSLMCLEHYAVDDTAAGDLLIQFMEKMGESTMKKQRNRYEKSSRSDSDESDGGSGIEDNGFRDGSPALLNETPQDGSHRELSLQLQQLDVGLEAKEIHVSSSASL